MADRFLTPLLARLRFAVANPAVLPLIAFTLVIVAASAPHRGEAFAACRAAIDRIKQSVPIWKKEWAPDGSALWVNLDTDTPNKNP